MKPEPGSWLWHITEWQNRFFNQEDVNIYGEMWEDARLDDYKF